MKKFTLLTTLILSAITFSAQIIHVPGDELTIQEAIDISSEGDTVLVAEDTYYENINFNGKKITVASEFILDNDTSHISNTIIDGSQPENPDIGSVVTFESDEDIASVICGFTITRGTGTELPQYNSTAGGGIYMYPAGGTIINNIIEYNSVTTNGNAIGGGILADHVDEGKVIILNNKIRYNQINGGSTAAGAGIVLWGSATVIGNEIIGNAAVSTNGPASGGLVCEGGYYTPELKEIIIAENSIVANSAHSYLENDKGAFGGGMIVVGYKGLIKNNTVLNNEIGAAYQCYSAGIYLESNSDELIIENNSVIGNDFTEGTCIGGGIGVVNGEASLINNFVSNNKATYGGGVYFWAQNTDNVSSLINNTICNNEATEIGGGLLAAVSNLVILNTIIWGNTSPDGESIYVEESLLEVRHSNIEGEEEWPGQGNMNVDPEFQDDGYHLHWPSLIVNEGKSTIQINGEWYDAPEYDIDGEERPFDGTYPDIGADEAMWYHTFVDEPANNQTSVLNIYPNPFSNATTIAFELQTSSAVSITIYNHLGGEVDMILDENMPKGKHNVEWNAKDQPAGVYYCVLRTKNKTQTVKIIRF